MGSRGGGGRWRREDMTSRVLWGEEMEGMGSRGSRGGDGSRR